MDGFSRKTLLRAFLSIQVKNMSQQPLISINT